MKYETTRFGQIEVNEKDIITIPRGPLGFHDETRFTLIEEKRAEPFKILQSLSNPSLAFVVVDPLIFRKDYYFELSIENINIVNAISVEDLTVLVIVMMANDIKDITANLQAPIVLNHTKNVAHQCMLGFSKYTTREHFLMENKNV